MGGYFVSHLFIFVIKSPNTQILINGHVDNPAVTEYFCTWFNMRTYISNVNLVDWNYVKIQRGIIKVITIRYVDFIYRFAFVTTRVAY